MYRLALIVSSLAMFGASAQAEPVRLLCQLNNAGIIYADEPPQIVVDEQQGFVTIHVPAQHFRDPTGVSGGFDGRGGTPPVTVGPSRAAFTPETITLSGSAPSGQFVVGSCWSINRLTGQVASGTCPAAAEGRSLWTNWTCAPARPRF